MSSNYILGLESSCDETAAAIVLNGTEVISSTIASQVDLHAKYGGVVPEIAARAHIENIIPVLQETFDKAGIEKKDISAVAVANCPGLKPALHIGVAAAKTLSFCWGVPLIAVNHVHCHIQAVLLEDAKQAYPAVALVVSGGHTSLYKCTTPLDLKLIGQTIDDAAGEAFDKVAQILQLPYPGGPHIERIAKEGDPNAITFPRSMLDRENFDFSFSGLKTSVLYHCHGKNMAGKNRVPDMSKQEVADIAASFQAAVIDVLCKKTVKAAKKNRSRTVLLGGGVACNNALREALQLACDDANLELLVSPKKYCTDNAAMIAGLGWHKFKAGLFASLALQPNAGHDLLLTHH